MRLFICIDLDKNGLETVERAKDKLKNESVKGRFPSREHMHLTLNFLGDVEDERLEDVIEAMESVEFSEITLNMSGLGWFSKRRGKIYWIGFQRCQDLLDLYKRLHIQLKKKGFKLEKREYTPHVTLGRDVKVEEDFNPASYSELVAGRSLQVREIVLKRSERLDSKLVHSKVFTRSAQQTMDPRRKSIDKG